MGILRVREERGERGSGEEKEEREEDGDGEMGLQWIFVFPS